MGFVKENQIFLNQTFADQEAVFQFLGAKTVELNIAKDETAVITSLKAREAESTTGMLEGFAIPHAKSNSINEASMLIVQLAESVEWNSLDGIPTDFVIALFIPDDEVGTTHLKLLSQVARMLMKVEFREQLRSVKDEAALAQLLNERLED